MLGVNITPAERQDKRKNWQQFMLFHRVSFQWQRACHKCSLLLRPHEVKLYFHLPKQVYSCWVLL